MWLYGKTIYHDGDFIKKSWFGGRIRACMSTVFNPGTWFVYFGTAFRITINKEDLPGLTLKWRTGFLYYHLLWKSGEFGWSFPWREYAVGTK